MKKWRAAAAVVLFVAVFLFYWYEYRPSKIKTECSDYAHKAAYEYTDGEGYGRYDGTVYDARYEFCLSSHGL